VYLLVVLRRMLRQSGYKPVLEDWIWHQILPLIGYAMLFVGAAACRTIRSGTVCDRCGRVAAAVRRHP